MDNPKDRESIHHRRLLETMREGYVLGTLLLDSRGAPYDYRILAVNPAFEAITGVNEERLVGRTARELAPDREPPWLESLSRVALSGRSEHFEAEVEELGKILDVAAYCPGEETFGLVIADLTEERRAQADFEQGKEIFEAAIERFPGAFTIYDRDRRLVFLNETARRMIAVPREELLGRRDEEILPPEFRDQCLPALKRVYRTKTPESLTVKLGDSFGNAVHRIHYVPILDEDERVQHVLSIGYDISELHRAREAAEASEARYRELFDAMGEGYVVGQMIYDSEGRAVDYRITEANDGFERLTGIPREKALGEKISQVIPEIEEIWIAKHAEVVNSGKDLKWEAYNAYTQAYYEVYSYKTGADRFASIFSNITDLKEGQAALEVSEATARQHLEEIEAIYRNAPVGLCVLDRDLRFLRINQRLAEINGPSVEEHLGRTVREVVPEVANAAEEGLRRVLETGEPRLGIEIVGATPAQPGVEHTWLESWLPVHDGNGRVIGLNLVVQDITDLKEAQEQLIELTESLERKIDRKSTRLNSSHYS